MLPVLGERISASTVSGVGKQLDAVVKAFHRRPLKDHYRVLIFDGVMLSRKSGAGAPQARACCAGDPSRWYEGDH